ncbi:MAG: tetratricopeptide repeat protein [Candidatus Omnitrophota bacterium]
MRNVNEREMGDVNSAVGRPARAFLAGFLLLGTVSLVPDRAVFAENESPVMVTEISFQDSFKKAVEENDRMRKKNEELEDKLRVYYARNSMYAERIKILSAEAEKVTAALEDRRTLEKEKIELEARVTAMQDELAKLQELNDIQTKRTIEAEMRVEAAAKPKGKKKGIKRADMAGLNEEERKAAGAQKYNEANALFRIGNYEKASEKYEESLEYVPDDPDTLYNLAVTYDYFYLKPDKAVVVYEKYVERYPDADNIAYMKERLVANRLKATFDIKSKLK